jgi:hypothetical protein
MRSASFKSIDGLEIKKAKFGLLIILMKQLTLKNWFFGRMLIAQGIFAFALPYQQCFTL